METLDLKQELQFLYQPSAKKIEAVEVPEMQFLRIDGAIEAGLAPGSSPLFEANLQALYGAAYTLKFMARKRPADPVDYPVMALEGLWWVEDGCFDIAVKDNWHYTLMIMVPDLVTPAMFAEALAQLRKKKGDQPAFARLCLERFHEGLCVQVMHLGPYAEEPATVERMRQFMQAEGYQDLVERGGRHHEIYLGDPRRAAPEKRKTVLRHPVKKVRP
ncbi:MAG: GyrI-like domain-containing protein [Anaerolineales bacterium]|nr:GyrI-like domain-containing protein [Anaerolineales bacterium]